MARYGVPKELGNIDAGDDHRFTEGTLVAELPLQSAGVLEVALLTGGFDKPYAFGLSMALVVKGVRLDLIGGDRVHCPEMESTPGLTFLNLQPGWSPNLSRIGKVSNLVAFYTRLLKYAMTTKARVFHILWNNRFVLFDRTILMIIYKLLGKQIVLTAHNINTAQRDGADSWFNRVTLRWQYHLIDHIFVHTRKMQDQLVREFCVRRESVTVIPFGINNAVPHTNLTYAEAKHQLGIRQGEKIILFFGSIRPYKGLLHLVEALKILIMGGDATYRLVVAGIPPNEEGKRYWAEIQRRIDQNDLGTQILQRIEYVPDEETEVYFKAADVAILPYTYIYQSGVLSLSYSFGLPVIATDVGAFAEEVVEGETGFLCKTCDPVDLARAIRVYFASSLYEELENHRHAIQKYAVQKYSWDTVGALTCGVYAELLGQ